MTYPVIRPYFGAPAATAPVLGLNGQWFTDHGQRTTIIEASDFSLLRRYLDGDDVAAILRERAAFGFNCLRVWALNQSVVGQRNGSPLQPPIDAGIHPGLFPSRFYPAVRALTQMAGSYGLSIEWTAFTSTQDLMPVVVDQYAHWDRMQIALDGLDNVLLELVNEYDWGTGQNAPDRSLWDRRPMGMIASSGSSTADAPPPEPVWDYVLHHTNGLNEWHRRVGHNSMEMADHFRCPAIANENMRYPDGDGSIDHAVDAAAGGALLTAGYCFHSQHGKLSVSFGQSAFGSDTIAPVDQAAAAWVRGARSVPLEFQAGAYRRRDDLLVPGLIRVYERRLNDGRGHIVKIRE